MLGLAYAYSISKNQTVYVNWGRMSNSANASYDLIGSGDIVGSTSAGGVSARAVAVGMNLTF